jgi:hypothetical protein
VLQRDGSTYGQVIDIEPNSARGPSSGGASLDNEELSLGDPHFDGQLTGFYPFQTKMGLFYQIDQDGWRRTKREFSILIGPPEPAGKGGRLLVHLYVPDRVIRRFGPMTLSVRVEGHRLVPENYRRAGLFTFDRMLPAEWVAHGPLHVDFTLDRAGSAESSHDRNLGDDRDLGILVRTISLDPA